MKILKLTLLVSTALVLTYCSKTGEKVSGTSDTLKVKKDSLVVAEIHPEFYGIYTGDFIGKEKVYDKDAMETFEDDIVKTMDLLQEVKPQQIFSAGDFADPHGTHKVCFNIILEALKRLKNTEEWIEDCWLWLYRGAWHEFEIDEIEMAVPLSPKEVLRKRQAIFKHQSQKDIPVFPGDDAREFWVRAEDRTRETAKAYNDLGLAEYEAIEAFVRWKF